MKKSTELFDSQSLIRWFLREKRDLPWRQVPAPSPYAVWVSEVMLQQTQVAVVIPYFERWMTKFPTIQDLARASVEDVIKVWEGLGYYSRARNLHEGARYVVEYFGGRLPEDPVALAKIKGLGPYTVGAICSFAFHQKTPAVDGNVLRVLSRYFMISDDISKPKTVGMIRKLAADILPDDQSWVVNEGLIELGATLCGRKPACQECPLRTTCKGYAQGVAGELPVKSAKYQSEALYRTVAVLRCEGRYLVRQCPAGEIMSGLYEFPYFETRPEGISRRALIKNIRDGFKVAAKFAGELPEVKHSFTRYRVTLTPCRLECDRIEDVAGFQWIASDRLSAIPFSSGHKRILEHLF